VSSLLVILLVIAAGAALIAQLVWWLSGRPEPGRVPPPLVVPIHPGYARTPQVSARVPAADAAPVAVPAAAQTADAVRTEVVTDAAPAETIQFLRPTDDALQLLPARLEVVSGMTPQQVIRFVRIPGKPAEMILGRERASSPQQVTLTSSTVSRRHARVTYADGRWLVSNLSRTNPVVVNDQALDEFEGARPLLDGDRIELGDVVLRFCTS
jgi:FHA domain-containing protein